MWQVLPFIFLMTDMKNEVSVNRKNNYRNRSRSRTCNWLRLRLRKAPESSEILLLKRATSNFFKNLMRKSGEIPGSEGFFSKKRRPFFLLASSYNPDSDFDSENFIKKIDSDSNSVGVGVGIGFQSSPQVSNRIHLNEHLFLMMNHIHIYLSVQIYHVYFQIDSFRISFI